MPQLRQENFRHRVRISRMILPKRRQRVRLPKKIHPKTIALAYYRAFLPVLERAHELIVRELSPLLPALAQQGAEAKRVDAVRTDAIDLNALIDRLGKEFFDRLQPSEIVALATEFARRTADWEKEQSSKQVRAAFGVDVLAQEPKLAGRSTAFVQENVALIKSIPSQFFDDVEKRVARAVARGATPEQLAKEIKEAHGVSDSRAMLIARDQIGKYYGQVAQARQQAMGVTHYTWRTSGDERVREEHVEREGQVFAWDDPPEGGHPLEAIQCRCFAEPVLTPLLEGDEPHARTQHEEPEFEVEEIRPEQPELDEVEIRRQAHAAELERRLAEQESARVALQARVLEQEQAAHRAEEHTIREREEALAREAAERARAQAEREARERAEQLAREAQAEAERLRAAETARQAEIAGRKPVLQKEHLEQSQGVSEKVARQREQHLERMLAEAPDHKALAEALPSAPGTTPSAAQQAEIRDELNRIVTQATGARIGVPDLQNASGREIEVKEIGFNGLHYRTGKIEISPEVATRAQAFFKRIAEGFDYSKTLTAEVMRIEREGGLLPEHKAMRDKIDALSQKILTASKKTKPALRAERDALQKEFERALADSPKERAREADAARILLHESLHGHSPLSGDRAYEGAGVAVEEVSTELAARVTMNKAFGISHDTADGGSYKGFIEATTEHYAREASEALGRPVTRDEAYAKAKDASVAYKADHRALANTPEETVGNYVNKMADQFNLTGEKRATFERKMREAFHDDIIKRSNH